VPRVGTIHDEEEGCGKSSEEADRGKDHGGEIGEKANVWFHRIAPLWQNEQHCHKEECRRDPHAVQDEFGFQTKAQSPTHHVLQETECVQKQSGGQGDRATAYDEPKHNASHTQEQFNSGTTFRIN